MYYDFCWIHQTLRVTLAMEAGVTDHVWSLEEIVKLAESKVRMNRMNLKKYLRKYY
jgi:hypothetical protein